MYKRQAEFEALIDKGPDIFSEDAKTTLEKEIADVEDVYKRQSIYNM